MGLLSLIGCCKQPSGLIRGSSTAAILESPLCEQSLCLSQVHEEFVNLLAAIVGETMAAR